MADKLICPFCGKREETFAVLNGTEVYHCLLPREGFWTDCMIWLTSLNVRLRVEGEDGEAYLQRRGFRLCAQCRRAREQRERHT